MTKTESTIRFLFGASRKDIRPLVHAVDITIGDGAVIGTRALVTKDVPPYTIVGGTPARVLRKRFSEDTISALLRLKWWDWPIEHIQRYIPEIQSGQVHPLLSAHPE